MHTHMHTQTGHGGHRPIQGASEGAETEAAATFSKVLYEAPTP
jgi:hypothetical protein